MAASSGWTLYETDSVVFFEAFQINQIQNPRGLWDSLACQDGVALRI